MIVPKLTEFDYVLKDERDLPPEEQTVFRLRPLTYREHEEIERGQKVAFDRKSEKSEMLAEQKVLSRKILNLGLVGWRNLRDEDGAEIEFRKGGNGKGNTIPEELFDLLAPVANELSNAITEHGRLGRDVSKNF